MSAKDLWRSKDMSSCKLTASVDTLRVLLGNLIKTELVQFMDENEQVPLFQRNYAKDMAKISEVEQKLQFLRAAIENSKFKIHHQMSSNEMASITEIDNYLERNLQEYKQLSSELQQHEKSQNIVYAKSLAYKYMDKCYFGDVVLPHLEMEGMDVENPDQRNLYTETIEDNMLNVFLFLCPRKITSQIQRTLYRITYSNVMFNPYSLDEEVDEVPVDLVAVYVNGKYLAEKCKRVVSSYSLSIYEIPENII